MAPYIAIYGGMNYSQNMSKKIATTIYITEQQQALLKELNMRSRVPVAEYIRQGIDMVLDNYKDILPGQLELEELPSGQNSPKKVSSSIQRQT